MTRALNLAALALVLISRLAAAEETNAHTKAAVASRVDFDSFRLITERNIFNPNRSGRRDYTRREPDRRTRVESFALVGTMSYEKGRIAFFDGSSSDYRKVIGASDTIAGYTVASVTPEHVTLQSTNQPEVKLPVGMQMRRVEDGNWELSERSQTTASAGSAASTSDGTSSSSGGGSDDVLKRLMQRREQDGAPAPEPVPSPRDQSAAPESNSKPAQAEPSSDGGSDDVLKRLLQRREQETQR
jgi:hypothetical protein